jgi:hypothetical protein
MLSSGHIMVAWRSFFMSLSTSLLLAIGQTAQPASDYPELKPVDEAAQKPDFFSFRAQLQAAVARHDTAAVLAVLNPGIRTSFGDGGGVAAFRRQWRPESADSKLWDTLARVLALGGSFQPDGTFVAPYTFSRWPETLDSFEHVAIVGDRVSVRGDARTDAAILTTVGFVILPIGRDARPRSGRDDRWIAVRLTDGRVGYVSSQFARSPIDYRAIFAKTGDRWQLMAFVAGD